MEYTGNTAHVRSGDTLFLYTDGMPEARNTAEDDFTEESLIATLAATATLSCQDLISFRLHRRGRSV